MKSPLFWLRAAPAVVLLGALGCAPGAGGGGTAGDAAGGRAAQARAPAAAPQRPAPAAATDRHGRRGHQRRRGIDQRRARAAAAMLAAAAPARRNRRRNGGQRERRRRGHRHGGKSAAGGAAPPGAAARAARLDAAAPPASRARRRTGRHRGNRRRAAARAASRAAPARSWPRGASPPQPLALTGSLGAHDPAALVVNNTIYLFATGLTAKTSTNLTTWQNASNPLNPRPAWVAQNVPGATNLWAPDIAFFGGMYHLYYAASTFGSNRSCIGHATKADIATGSWTDQGTVICSNMGTSDNWNAIDPNIVIDDAGTPWMDFGSFWGGIKMIKIDAATGGRATDDTMVYSIADRPPAGAAARRAPWIFKRCGYYYLFESWGACCDGAYDYNMRVGRSTSVNKDYVDKAGLQAAWAAAAERWCRRETAPCTRPATTP